LFNFSAFQEHVSMKFQIYNGLFLNLPFSDVKSSGILLPVFAEHCKKLLEDHGDPVEIVESFFKAKLGTEDFNAIANDLFRFMRLVERQVVLFDSLEDAAYVKIRDLDGPGSVKDTLNKIEQSGKISEYLDLIRNYKIRTVLTAHPTQFYTDEVLAILTDLAKALEENDLQSINNLLLQMGKTRFKKKKKPSPLDEANSIMWILENVLYKVIPNIHNHLMKDLNLAIEDSLEVSGKVELGFWPGGDRDGNPYVTADLSKLVGEMLRSRILNLYLQDIKVLLRRLTFDGVIQKMKDIEIRLKKTINPLGEFSTVINSSEEGEKEDLFCIEVVDQGYLTAEDFLHDLLEVRKQIMENHMGLFVDQLDQLIYTIRCFGFHFASLDIRQDASVHGSTINQIIPLLFDELTRFEDAEMDDTIKAILKSIGVNDYKTLEYLSLDDEKKINLLQELSSLINTIPLHERKDLYQKTKDFVSDTVLVDCISSFDVIRTIQRYNGEMGAHRYIISHTEKAHHMLEVWLLGVLSGWNKETMPLDIVPLFETVEDLHNARAVMTQIYELGDYQEHLQFRNKKQVVMLGFSDGTKDGGYVTANWEIYKTKQQLSQLSKEKEIQVIFFDGRGGPPGRGGGNTHKFYRSLGPKISSQEIQLTIQGQTITSSYGISEAARYNLEQMVSSGLENNIFADESTALGTDESFLLDELSENAQRKYMELRNHERFLDYLEEVTPLKYYGKTNIGSRPSKRNKNERINLDNLRAIPFVGAWSQMKQNVPGFFGFGTAIKNLIDQGKETKLKDLYQNSLFFRTLIENSMQSLSKSYYALTSYLQYDKKYGEFWNILNDEANLTVAMIKRVSEQADLLETSPVIKSSILHRESMIHPILSIQQYALKKIRDLKESSDDSAKDEKIEILEKMVIKSLAASINASRNSV
jgi:phosphoenolpyruvate carboxylase